MADPIHDLLTPYFHALDTSSRPLVMDNTTTRYLNYLTGLSLSDLSTSESGSLLQHSHTLIRSLQSLSKRSHKSIISSVTHLSNLSSSLLPLLKSSEELQASVPKVESSAVNFTDKYRRATDIEDEVLTRRRKALLLSNNGDRISSILDLPTLLSTAISSASQPASTSSSVNHASALDLHAHIKRLSTLYPQSPLVSSISTQAEHEMKLLTTNLITSLQNQNVKLAGAMRTIGWLRRVAPELDESIQLDRQWGKRNIKSYLGNTEGALGALFLVARLKNLINMLDALEPLRDLADQETRQRQRSNNIKRASLPDDRSAVGQQTERYLKRYIEIFREQSFAIVTMYKSIFPSALPAPGSDTLDDVNAAPWSTCSDRLLLPLPSSLATFPSHLVDMLFETLRKYLPNVNDRASRDSLMTQVLYCAGSLGRLGGDFSMMLAFLEDDGIESDEEQILDTEFEWVEVTKKHRIQASKLELLASGVGTGKRAT